MSSERWRFLTTLSLGFFLGTVTVLVFTNRAATPVYEQCQYQIFDSQTYRSGQPAPASSSSSLFCNASVIEEFSRYLDTKRGFASLPAQPHPSGHPRIFGLGLSKTGTTSLTAALKELGIQCVHWKIEPVLDLMEMELQAVSPISVDVVRRWEEEEGVSDLPIPYFFEELMVMYPDAKFVLTVRDPASWWASLKSHFERTSATKTLPYWVDRSIIYGWHMPNEYFAVKAFMRHNKLVQQIIPPERLLVMDITAGDSFPKLCDFLGISPCPRDSFPHTNKKPKYQKNLERLAEQEEQLLGQNEHSTTS
ncbi:Sulfotransferase family protein [Balamuthia mandrillaris]